MSARHCGRTLGFLVGLSLGFSSPSGADEVPLRLPIAFDAATRHQRMDGFGVNITPMSPHKGVGLWMTEYGDLDQTGLVAWGVALRSTRRLLKFVADGFTAGMAWDAFDNLHEHDGVWALYGLLETDRDTWATRRRSATSPRSRSTASYAPAGREWK